MDGFKTLENLAADIADGEVILVRADLNISLDENGAVRDATRLERLLPTLKALSSGGYRIGILSHFGRPKGQRVADMSLAPVAKALANLLGQDVTFAEDCIGDVATSALADLPEGGVCVLENTRFHEGEETNDTDFSAALAHPAAAYVNDAFSAAHRAHASTHGITRHLSAYHGLAIQAELEALESVLNTPEPPLVAVVGGAKISTKIELLGNLLTKASVLIIGGGMANTFLAADGHDIGKSLCEDTMIKTANSLMAAAQQRGCRILLPSDVAIAPEFTAGQTPTIVSADAVPPEQMILDAGPDTIAAICAAFDKAATLIWNGPLGAFEMTPFDTATNKTAQHAANLTKAGKLVSVAGGGDTVAALNHAGAGADFTYVSTAGGAFLEWLEGKPLPGVTALKQN